MATPRIKTYYAYWSDGKLYTKPFKIASPYNVKTIGRTKDDDRYDKVIYIEFKDWQYTADEERLWKVLFEQNCEVCDLYNVRGWFLTKWDWELKERNWKINYRTDWIIQVRSEKIKEKNKEVEVKTEIKEVQVIPEIVANTMTITQLKDLANSWNIEISKDIMESWKADIVKTKIIDLFKANWHIK